VKLLLHIGSYRTGSTAVQQSLLRSRRFLRQQGILYPFTGLHDDGAHHRIAWRVTGRGITGKRDTRAFENVFDELAAEIRWSKAATVIISTEVLMAVVDQAADEAVRQRLGRLLSLFSEVDVLCCVRHQAPLLESLYRFMVAWPVSASTDSFPTRVAEWLEQPHLVFACSERFFRELRPECGFRFWSFAEAVASGSIVKRFYEVAGIAEAYRGERRLNAAVSREATLALLEWNRSPRARQRGRNAFLAWACAAFPEAGRSLYDAELLRSVIERFREDNALLERHAGLRLRDTPVPAAAADRLAGHVLYPDELERVHARLHRGHWPWPFGRTIR
jgi:hypothetical protein